MATVSGMTVERILEIENRISGVHTQQVNLTADLQEFSGEVTHLNTTVLPQLNLDLQEANEDLNTLQTVTLPSLNQSLSNLNAEIENLPITTIQNDLNTLEGNLGTLNTNLTNAQNDINNVTTLLIPNINSDLDELNNTTIPQLNLNLTNAQGELDNLNTTIIPQINTTLGTVNTELGTLNTDLGTLQTDLATANDLITGLDARADEAEADILSAQQSISSLNTNLTNAQGEINTLNDTTIPALNLSLSTAQTDLSTLKNTTVPALNTRLTTAEGELNTLETDLSNLDGELSTAQTDLSTLKNTTVPALNTRLTTAEGELNTLETDLGGLSTSLTTANSEIDDLQTATGVLSTNLNSAQGQINTLNNTTIPGLTTRLTTAEGELDTLGSNLSGLDGELATAQGQLNTLVNTTIPGINSTLNTAKNDIDAAELAISQRTKTIIQDTQPTGLTSADRVVWLDSNDGYRSYYWNGTAWTTYQLSGAAILPGGIVTSHMTANQINGDRITGGTIAADKIVANSLTAGQIATGAITADEVATNAVTADKILAGSVTTVKMVADSINGDRITADTLNASKIVAGSITTDRFTAGSISGNIITAGTIAADKITANSLTAGQIATGAIAADEIASNAVTAIKILAGAVTTDKMTANQINGDRITGGTIAADKIVANSLTAGQIATGAIAADEIASNAVTAVKILAGAVISDKILAGAVTTDKMTANEINGDRITGGTIAADKITANSLTAGQIATGAIAADEIASNAVTAVKILAGAVTTDKMTANQINGDRITGGTIAADKITANSLTAGQIATGAIAADEIASNAVTAVKILAGAVTTDKMTANTIEGDRIKTNTLNADRIVTGSITTDKMTANTIEGDRIKANTLHADKLVAGSLTIGKVTGLQPALDAEASKGTDLIKNGTGILGDNTNFSGLVADKTDAPPGSSLSFDPPLGVQVSPTTDEMIPIDPTKHYKFSVWAKQKGTSTTADMILRLYFYNGLGHLILMSNVLSNGSPATLTAPLNPGDTVIQVDTTAGWYTGPYIWSKYIGVWPYTDQNGRSWPVGTYTNQFVGESGAYDTITATQITLTSPYDGPILPVGTVITNQLGGDAANFAAAAWVKVPKVWTNYSSVLNPSDIPAGTTKVRAAFLLNYSYPANSKISVGGISLSDAAAAYSRWAPEGVTTIDGGKITTDSLHANRIIAGSITTDRMTANTIEGDRIKAGTIAADKITANSLTAGQIATGAITADEIESNAVTAVKILAGAVTTDKMTANTIDGDRITANTLNAAKIVAGSIVTDRLAANAITTEKMALGSTDNLLNDPAFNTALGSGSWPSVANASINATGGRKAGSPALQLVNNATQQALYNAGERPCEAGQAFHLSAWVKQTGAPIPIAGFTIGLRFAKADGSFHFPTTNNDSVIPVDTWTRVHGTPHVAPEGAVSVALYIASQSVNSTGTLLVDYVSWTRAGTGELIVDGTIKTNHMIAGTIEGDRIKANTLDAAKITAGTITGDRIAANAITTRTLNVGDFENLIADPTLSDPLSSNWDPIISNPTRVAPVGDTPGYIEWVTIEGTNAHIFNLKRFDARPGDKFFFRAEVSAPASNTNPVYVVGCIQTYSPSGGVVTWAQIPSKEVAPGAAWTEYSGVITIPAGTSTTGVFDPFAYAFPASAQVIRMRRMMLRRMNGGELIVDGSILTNHMTANTIEGDRIKANSLNASKILAGSITTDRMTANTIDGDRIKTNTLHADKIVSNSITAQKLSVRVGGNNLADNSDATAETPVPGNFGASNVTRDTAFKMPGKYASWKIASTSATNTFGIGMGYLPSQSISSGSFGINPNSVYTVTVDYYLPVDASGILSFTLVAQGSGVVSGPIYKAGPTVQGAWNTASITFATGASGTVVVTNWTNANPAVGKHFYVGQYMVHEGDIPQAWSPKAKELLPGTITANLLDADAINGKTITGATITGSTLRTAASGNRIEIRHEGTDNFGYSERSQIRFYSGHSSEYVPGKLFYYGNSSGSFLSTISLHPPRPVTNANPAFLNLQTSGNDSYIYINADSISLEGGITVLGDVSLAQGSSLTVTGYTSLNGGANSVVSTGIRDTLYDGPSVNCHPTNAIVGRSSSSRRYKTDIRPFTDLGGRSFLDVDPIIYKSKAMVQAYEEGEVKEKPRDIPGYLAETLAEDFPELVFYDDEGRPDSLRYDRMTAYMSIEVRALREQLQEIVRYRQVEIDQLKEELKGLKEKVGNL